MEDIYVRPKYRGIGAGARIFCEVAGKANEFNCKRMEFHVLEHNPAMDFYKKLGAIDLTATEHWHYHRVKEPEMLKLIQKLKSEKH